MHALCVCEGKHRYVTLLVVLFGMCVCCIRSCYHSVYLVMIHFSMVIVWYFWAPVAVHGWAMIVCGVPNDVLFIVTSSVSLLTLTTIWLVTVAISLQIHCDLT